MPSMTFIRRRSVLLAKPRQPDRDHRRPAAADFLEAALQGGCDLGRVANILAIGAGGFGFLGKTIGIDAMQSVVHSIVRVVAKAGGLDPESVTVTPMQPADTLSAFARHAIDGFAAGPPWPQQVVTDGTAVIVSDGAKGEPKEFSPIGSVMLVTRPQFCADHRSICTKMGHAMKLAADFIHDHPAESLAILKKRYDKVDDAVLRASYEAVREMTPQPPVPDDAELANAESMNIAAGFMNPAQRLKSYAPLFTQDFAR